MRSISSLAVWALWGGLSVGLSGCATPSTAFTVAPPQAVQEEVARQEQMVRQGKAYRESAPSPSVRFRPEQRVLAVAERVFMAASPYCSWPLATAYPVTIGVVGSEPPRVINAAGDLRFGDALLSLQGQPIERGQRGYVQAQRLGAQVARSGVPLTVSVGRGARVFEATYQPTTACALPVELHGGSDWNAYTDGQTLHLHTRLVNDLSNDDDLAFVIAHELAHALLEHVSKQQQNAMAGALVGLALEAVISGQSGMGGDLARAGAGMGQMQYSQDFEHEADYVGLYILAASGYDLEAGPRVARRIAQQDPRSINYASSHPSSAARAAGLAATVAEIQSKQKAGLPLLPNQRTRPRS